jgi:hypothetical protein
VPETRSDPISAKMADGGDVSCPLRGSPTVVFPDLHNSDLRVFGSLPCFLLLAIPGVVAFGEP